MDSDANQEVQHGEPWNGYNLMSKLQSIEGSGDCS